MYARSTTVRGDPNSVDEGIAYVRDEVMPAVQRMDGCVGLSMLADRTSGRCIVTTAWADYDALRLSADGVKPMRQRAAEIMGGEGLDRSTPPVAFQFSVGAPPASASAPDAPPAPAKAPGEFTRLFIAGGLASLETGNGGSAPTPVQSPLPSAPVPAPPAQAAPVPSPVAAAPPVGQRPTDAGSGSCATAPANVPVRLRVRPPGPPRARRPAAVRPRLGVH